MEKVIYVLAIDPGAVSPDLGARLLGDLPGELRAAGARSVAVNVSDEAVAPAEGLRMAPSPRPARALVSVWVDSAIDHLRAPVDAVVEATVPEASVRGYLVTESVPMVSDRPLGPDGRVDGYAQVALIQRRHDLTADEFLHIWHDRHTHVAIDLQDTFSYVQNVVVRTLTPGAPVLHAIVEECFPSEAMSDPHVFFDAVGDDERLARHQLEMFRSVERFLDLTTLEVVPTSRYER